jgi:hypothetical protein
MVTVARDCGQNVMTVNVAVVEVEGGYEWESVTLPNGRWGYGLIVDALVNARYTPDKVQAIAYNCLNNLFDAGSDAEFKALQDWRKQAKAYARQALEWAAEHGIGQAELEPEDEAPEAPTEVVTTPDGITMMQQAISLMQTQALDLPDEEAMNVPALFPTWESKIGQTVPVDERLFYDNRLWKVLQAHTVQADWPPTAAASLFTEVASNPEQGTLDNPIPYNGNMALEQGKYYSQDGVVYRCIRDTGNPVYHPLSQLVGLYVEVA